VAVIDGSVMLAVEVSDTAANGSVPPRGPPKLRAPALTVRSTGTIVHSPLQELSTAPPNVVAAAPELMTTFVSSRTSLANVIGPLLVVMLPSRLTTPDTTRPPSGATEPIASPKKTLPPAPDTVSRWPPSTVPKKSANPVPEFTVASALRVTALSNAI